MNSHPNARYRVILSKVMCDIDETIKYWGKILRLQKLENENGGVCGLDTLNL